MKISEEGAQGDETAKQQYHSVNIIEICKFGKYVRAIFKSINKGKSWMQHFTKL